MIRLRTKRLLLTGATFAALSSHAFALDGQDLLTKINAAYAAGSGVLKAEAIEVNGNDVVLKGTTFTATGPHEKSVLLGNLNLQDVTEEADGAYHIDRIEFPEVNLTEEKNSVKIKDLYLAGVRVPGNTAGEGLASMMLYEEAHSGPLTVIADGKQVFSLEEASGTMALSDDESALSFDGSVTGIKADLTGVEDAKSKDAIDALGLQTVTGEINVSGSWDPSSGTIDLDEYAIDLNHVGRLSLSFAFTGYTMDLVKQLQETARTMQADPNNEQAQQAAGIAMFGLMQQMSFQSARISIEDAGITKRGLDYAGKQQGSSGEQMGQMVKGMLPILLAQAKLGALQNEISEAVNTFIDDPQNITITAEPEKEVPFPMIMGAAMGAPESLPTLLGVSVSAND
ncbi:MULTISPECIES: hypothetical protein [Alphaproteobacteria]|uniref:Uncharacterized protein n=2 Tax=Alphaproteobacteria TaxID=28211 RepID=A0A512HGL7_9HYPH|nr:MULTISPECIES: hypothetical protein [Alphaproteobacteria]GEO84599.1 hypothetical protein RNA01_15310 [Ciceribacter naphthalenivorans]GLR22562.1 hypothetical protein GCM10007920_23490 [Ciceribacter naphthalenivorans]GLT05418.1 hypothetical protein GCM10007926_23490 [Sphingomonas psychrolutea]